MKALSNSRDCPRCGGNHKSKPFCLYENGWHCFSCGYSKAADRGFSIRELENTINPDFPESTSEFSKFSIEAQIWLTKFSVDAELVNKYNIYYCEDNSLIFPCYEQNVLKFYQKRNMKQRFITTFGQKQPLLLINSSALQENAKNSVIVEDYISAIRLHDAGFNVACLWGTKVQHDKLLEWFTLFDTILVWLDNDVEKEANSGQEAAKTIKKTGNSILNNKFGFSYCKKIVNILAEQDPKYYTKTEITNIVRGALNGQQDIIRRT